MKVLQIKRIVPDLINRVALKFAFSNLKLEYEHKLFDDQHNVDSSTDAGQYKFEERVATTGVKSKHGLKQIDLLPPCLHLWAFNCEPAATGQGSTDCIRGSLEKSSDRVLVVRSV